MKIVKLYTGENNKSYFEEINIEYINKKSLGDYSETYPASGIIFRDAEPGLTFDWHNAPQPQYIIYLEGKVEIQASGGETRLFKPGDILFATDLTGEGHITKILSKNRSMIVTQ